jgi:signal transduction histidine kinase
MVFALAGIFATNLASGHILSQYGYSGDTGLLGLLDYAAIICAAAVFALLITAANAAFDIWEKKRRTKRIADLTVYLRKMNIGDYTLRPDVKEDELSPLEDELYKTVVLLREGREIANREKERLADNLADISHQMKTPLASISLMSDLLSSETCGKQIEYTSRITAQAERLNALVATLLALSRLDAGTLELEKKAGHEHLYRESGLSCLRISGAGEYKA